MSKKAKEKIDFSKRTNFYDDWIFYNDPLDSDMSLFWPTDEEFKILSDVCYSQEYLEYQFEFHGEDNVVFSIHMKYFSHLDRYNWLCENLQKFTKGYTVALTKEMVFESLKEFEEEVVKPYLELHSPYSKTIGFRE